MLLRCHLWGLYHDYGVCDRALGRDGDPDFLDLVWDLQRPNSFIVCSWISLPLDKYKGKVTNFKFGSQIKAQRLEQFWQ